MRITGGRARGITLKAPKGELTRPATDRMRESVFSSLGPQIEGTRVADLFAGTGAYGLEALSRGASEIAFFEKDKKALDCLRANLKAVQKSLQTSESSATVVSRDLFQSAPSTGPYDLIFIDPPYDQIESILAALFQTVIEAIATPDATVIFELPGQFSPEIAGWQMIRRLGKIGRDKPTTAFFQRLP